MRIAFLGSSLAPGRNGVGDYLRCLADELSRQGHACLGLGLADEADETAPGLCRIAAVRPWPERTELAAAALDEFAPDWVSLQFVAYAWHPRGWAFGLAPHLRPLCTGRRTHVMLHELWVGISRHDRAMNRLHGLLQRRAVLSLLRGLNPAVVHTQTPAYAEILAGHGVAAKRLPLFGNLPVDTAGAESALRGLLATGAGAEAAVLPREQLLVAGWFGTVHPEWDSLEMIGRLHEAARAAGRRLVLLALGRTGRAGEDLARSLTRGTGREIVFRATGALAPDQAARLLAALDLGLTSNPAALAAKSGTVAAFLDFGVPVLVSRDDWRPRHGPAATALNDPLLVFSPPGSPPDLPALLALRRAPQPRLPAIAAQFAADLAAAQA